MARIAVEQSALTDPRYARLGKLLGISRWDALGRMTYVWNHCQESFSYVLDAETVNHLFDDISGLSEALLKSGLAQKHRHGLYISGTKGRIEWLENKRRAGRENGKLGGRPKKTEAKGNDNQDRLRTETPPAPAVTKVKVKSLTEDSNESSRPSRKRSDFPPESREHKAAAYLAAKIRTNKPDARTPKDLQAWAQEFDLIFRVDGRSAQQVRKVIDWCQADAFWRVNILSAAKLRKQFDTLELASQRTPSQTALRTKQIERAPLQED